MTNREKLFEKVRALVESGQLTFQRDHCSGFRAKMNGISIEVGNGAVAPALRIRNEKGGVICRDEGYCWMELLIFLDRKLSVREKEDGTPQKAIDLIEKAFSV